MHIHSIQNEEDYKSFILTFLAEADYNVSPEEKEIILHHVSAEKYEQIKHAIDRMSDFECIGVIESYKNEYLPNPESKAELLNELEELYLADGKKSVLERNLILGLRKIL